jgi:cellulose synthase operon protein C
MFRGMKNNVHFAPVASILMVLALGLSQMASAKSEGRRGDAITGKLSAPNLDDHAAYFSPASSYRATNENLAKADKLRLKTIRSIKSLLSSKKKSIRRFELLLRLGELYVERHDYLREKDMDTYEIGHNSWINGGKKGREPKLNVSKSRSEMTKAINSFRKLVTEYPKHRRTDAALFSLAKALGRQGKATAANYYKQLLSGHPRSPLIAEATLALGEYYFDRHDIANSVVYYKKAMKYKKHAAYPYAVYKLGWAFYNTGEDNKGKNYRKAVTAFKLVVKLADKDENNARRGINLREEALRDLVMVWADAGDVKSAWRYFKTIGEKKSFYAMLERLGAIYNDQGKNRKAIALYERILKEAPLRKTNPRIHETLADLHDRTNQIGKVVKDLNQMTERYLGKSKWTTYHRKDTALIADAAKKTEHKLHFYGTTYHQRGQKAKSTPYLKSSSAVYGMYLKNFSDNKNSYEVRYYLAEISYDTKRFQTASNHYMIVAKDKKQTKYKKPAALNAVASMNQFIATKKFGKLPPAGQVAKPISIPPSKAKLMEVMQQYVQILPSLKEGRAMRFTTAQIYFDYGHYNTAIKKFDQITKDIPKTKQGKSAARVILGYFTEKQDWSNLTAWCRTFNKRTKLLDKSLRIHVASLLHNSMFKQALAMEKAKKFEKSSKLFLAFQKEFPKNKNADRALYNATLGFYKIGQIELAISAGLKLKSIYPKSKSGANNMANLASSYESFAQYDKAADMYRQFAVKYSADQRAPGALFNASLLYKGLNNKDKASSLLDRFVKFYPKHKIASDAYMELAEIYETQGNYQFARNTYRAFSKKFSKDVNRSLLADAKAASIRTFNISESKGLVELRSVAKRLNAKNAPAAFEARRTVAKAMYTLVDPAFGNYMAYRLTSGKKIEKQVGTKQGKLVTLAKRYQEVIDLGSGEYSVASLYRLGSAHENFSQELFKAPAPKGASQKDVDAFKTELEKVAFPLKTEAFKFYETAYMRSTEVETFTTWTQKSYDKMVELAPDKHPVVDVMVADPAYLSQSIAENKQIADLIVD